MPVFKKNEPIETNSPTIRVENTDLPVGRHAFQLVVEDEAGNRSEPAQTTIMVHQRSQPPIDRPTILEVIRENPGISLTGITNTLHIRNRNILRPELERMREEGIIRIDTRGRYFIS